MTDRAPLLSMQGIAKRFGGIHALKGVDLELRHGEVHALLGENGAGKSTLINVLSGIYADHDGTIAIDGEPRDFKRPADAQAAGVATIHQELDLVPDATVAENLFLGREPRTRLGLLDRRRMTADARELLAGAGVSLDPNRPLRSLRVGEQQLVEIVKSLTLDARILVMDEPTSALADAEVEQLFDVIRDLRRREVGIVYVSHRMEELFAIADRATVLRDGGLAGTVTMADTDRGELIRLMVGRELHELFPRIDAEAGEPVLELEGFGIVPRRPRPGRAEPRDVDLTVRAGEVVGLCGLMGAGRTELLQALFGEGGRGRRTGTMRLDGEAVEIGSPRQALAHGIGFVPEDRKADGLNLVGSVGDNVSTSALGAFTRGGLVRTRPERDAVDAMIRDLAIKTSGRGAAVGTLSGGNQQKVVFAKQLLTKPRLLLLDEPTRGVDVGAKAEIYRLLSRLASEGLGILLASSELPELLGICDRILVLQAGHVVEDLSASEATQERLLDAATRKEVAA